MKSKFIENSKKLPDNRKKAMLGEYNDDLLPKTNFREIIETERELIGIIEHDFYLETSYD